MNIQGMNFQSTNEFGGKISKFAWSMENAWLAWTSSKWHMLTVREFATIARVSVVSAHRYWQHIDNNGGRYLIGGSIIKTYIRHGRKIFVFLHEEV